MITNRQIEIIKVLSQSKEPLKGEAIARVLYIPIRTLRNEFKQLYTMNSFFEKSGFQVFSKYGEGYFLEISNNELFTRFLIEHEPLSNYRDTFYEYEIQLIAVLLLSDDYFLLEELENILYINRTTLYEIISHLKNSLSEYNLKLIISRGKGYKIEGSELNVRLTMQLLLENNLTFINEKFTDYLIKDKNILEEILEIQLSTIRKFMRFEVPYKFLVQICEYIYISNQRNKLGKYTKVTESELTAQKKESPLTYQIASDIVSDINKKLNYNLTKYDEYYIYIMMKSYRILKIEDSPLRVRYFKLGYNALSYISSKININYEFNSLIFANRLASQLASLEARNKNGMPIIARYSSKINARRQLAPANEITYHILYYLFKYEGFMFSENDVYHLTPIFTFLSKRYILTYRKPNLVVISKRGANYAEIVKERILLTFQSLIGNIDCYDYMDFNSLDLNKYDLVFTDNVELSGLKNVFYFEEHINDQTMYKILKFLNTLYEKSVFSFLDENNILANQTISSVKQFWPILYEKLTSYYQFDMNIIIEELRERNDLLPFEIGNNSAVIFIQNKLFESTSFYIVHLKRPIIWDKEYVQVVFVICCKWDEFFGVGYLTNELRMLVNSSDKINRLISKPSYNNLVSIRNELIREYEL